MATIDLNADLGEGCAFDRDLLRIVSSCNIACGAHAGDVDTMAATARIACENGVVIGAHPGYPDPEGFGRRSNFLAGQALRESLVQQLEVFGEILERQGVRLTHIKPHGALYNDAAVDPELAELMVEVCGHDYAGAALVGPPQSALQSAAERSGVAYLAEAFTDRAYLPDGHLVPRDQPGAVLSDIDCIKTQALALAQHGTIVARNGADIAVAAETLCIHGDTPHAVAFARAVRDHLLAHGVEIRAAA